MSSYVNIIQQQLIAGASQTGQALQIRSIRELIQISHAVRPASDIMRQGKAYADGGTASPVSEQQNEPNPSPAPMPGMDNRKTENWTYDNRLVPTLG
jgi:hypothetical protein